MAPEEHHHVNGNGNGKVSRLLLTVVTPLAIAGIIGTIVMYGQLSAMTTAINNLQDTVNKNHAELDRRISKIEGDVYAPRFSKSNGSTPVPQALSIP